MEAWTLLTLTAGSIALLFVLLRRLRGRSRGAAGTLRAFLRHCDARGVPDDVAVAVFHHLQRWMVDTESDFPVRAGDSLERVYGIAPSEVTEALRLLVGECGRSWPEGETARGVATVDDLVRFVCRCPLAAPLHGAAEDAGRPDPVG